MSWNRTVSSNGKRPLAHPQEILAAIDRALAEESPQDEQSAKQLAPKVKRHIPISENQIEIFIKKQMTPEQRAERKIREPKRNAPTIE